MNLPNPCDAVEFIDDEGRRFAWSESNIQYEEVPEDGASFTLLRNRLEAANSKLYLYEQLASTGEVDGDAFMNDPTYHAIVYRLTRR